MRKNVLKNKQVIRAMAIGISAVMATSPLTAMAAEPDTLPASDRNDGTTTEQPTAVEEAQAAASSAASASETTDTAIEEVKEIAAEVKTEEENDLNTAITEVEKIVTGEQDGEESDTTSATEDIQAVEEELNDAEQAAADATGALEEANTAAEETAAIAAGVVSAENQANEQIDAQLSQMKEADTVEEAQSAYAAAQQTAANAQQAYDEAKKDYDEKKASYEQAVADLAAAQSEYEEAINNAEADAEAAAEKLAAAEEAAAVLKEEANKAAEEMANNAAIQIAQMEAERATDNYTQWRKLDVLFEAIIKEYYVPTHLNGEVTSYVRTLEANDEYNVFTVTYKTEDGEEKTVYLNYKLTSNHDGLVIFEKNWDENAVLVKDAEAEKYVGVDADGNAISYSAAELEQAVADGTVVKLEDGTYVATNGEGTTVSAGVKLGTTTDGNTTIVTEAVDGTEEESYALDQDGNLVKTVTQDVTTITYTSNSLSGEGYDSEEAAKAAAEEAIADAEDALAEGTEMTDVEMNIAETTEYTGTATYVSTFTKTIDVNEDKTLTYKSASEVASDVKEDVIDDNTDDLWRQGYYVLKNEGELTAEKTEDRKVLGDDYEVTGQITLTYAKYTTEKVSYTIWDDFKDLFTGNATKEKIEAAFKQKIEAEGGIFIKLEEIDWNAKTATCYYVPGQKVTTTGTYATEEEAKAAAEEAVGANAYNVNVSTTSETTYSYTASYNEKTETTEEDVVMSTTTWEAADALDYVAATEAKYEGKWVNDNYRAGNIELNEYEDEAFRKYIEDAQAKKAAYEELAQKAAAAEKAAKDAGAEVEALQQKIDELKDNMNSVTDAATLSALKIQMENAEENRKEAEKTLDDIKKKLEEAEADYNEVVKKLTPSETPSGGATEAGGAGTTTATGNTSVVRTVTIEEEEAPLAATVTQARTGRTGLYGAAESEGEENLQGIGYHTIEEEEAPLASTVIEDEETALAAKPIGEEKISWWWLLIIAVLGATGYEAYKKYRKNKMAKEGNIES